jgi:hypothetical protein
MSSRKDERNEEVLRAHEAGVPTFVIMELAGISRSRVSYILRRFKSPPPPHPEVAERNARNERMCDLYISGKSLSQIGREFGLCDAYVARILKRMGVKMRPWGGRWRKFAWEDVPPTTTPRRERIRRDPDAVSRPPPRQTSRKAQPPRPKGKPGRKSGTVLLGPAEMAARDAHICEAYKAGISSATLARKHGITPSCVRRILNRAGLPMRAPGRRRRRYAWEDAGEARAPSNPEEDHI